MNKKINKKIKENSTVDWTRWTILESFSKNNHNRSRARRFEKPLLQGVDKKTRFHNVLYSVYCMTGINDNSRCNPLLYMASLPGNSSPNHINEHRKALSKHKTWEEYLNIGMSDIWTLLISEKKSKYVKDKDNKICQNWAQKMLRKFQEEYPPKFV